MKKGYLGLAAVAGLLCLTLSTGNVCAKMTKEAHQYYQQASVCECKQDMQEAIKLIKKAIEVNNDDDVMLYTKLGGLYSNTEQYSEAITAYQKAIELRPTDAFIYVSLGSIYQITNNNEKALESYQRAMELCPEYKYNYINIANVLLNEKKYDESSEYYNKFLELYPDNDEAKANLAESYFMSDKPDKACEIFKIMYEKNPQGFKEYSKYGTALYKMKEYGSAIPILEKAIEQDSNSVKTMAQLALCYQHTDNFEKAEITYAKMFELAPNMNEFRLDYANMLSAQGKDKEAIKQYNSYIETFPNDADGYINLGALYKRINNTDMALTYFEKAYSINHNDMDTVKDLAYCYHQKYDYENAIKYYDIALKEDSSNYSLQYNRAIALHALEKYEDAIKAYETVLSLKNDEVIKTNLDAAYVEYGYKLFDEGNYQKARENFEKVALLSPKEPSAYMGIASTYNKEGNKALAMSYYQKAVELAPDNEDYLADFEEFKKTLSSKDLESMTNSVTGSNDEEYSLLVATADNYFKNKDFKSALQPYLKALAIKPDKKEVMLKIGNIYKDSKDWSKASEYYQKAIGVDDKYTDAWFNEGLVYANTNKLNDAIDCFNRVISIDSDYTYAYYALGLAYEYEHNNTKAIDNYKKYVTLEKDQNLINTINDKIKQLQK